MKISKKILQIKYNKNKTIKEIADLFNCSKSTVYYSLKKYKIQKRMCSLKYLELTKEFLEREYVENKKSANQIANEIGCAYSVIKKRLIRFNIPIKPNANHNSKYGKIITKKLLIKEYIQAKKSTYQIAKELKCSPTIIKYYLKKYNIKIRTKIEACKYVVNGNLHGNFKDGRSSKTYYCKEKECNNTICYCNWKYGKGYCAKCAKKGKRHPFFGKKRPKHSKRMNGNKNPSFIDGNSNLPYPLEFNDKLRLKIRKRDNYTCQKCGITEEEHITVYGKILTVHHIDYSKQNCKETNLTTLCNECNSRVNFNRTYWKIYFQSKIRSIYV